MRGFQDTILSQIASSIILWHDHTGTHMVLIHNIVQQATLTDKIYTTIKKKNMHETLFYLVSCKKFLLALIFASLNNT
jgi:hypothetical protein